MTIFLGNEKKLYSVKGKRKQKRKKITTYNTVFFFREKKFKKKANTHVQRKIKQ